MTWPGLPPLHCPHTLSFGWTYLPSPVPSGCGHIRPATQTPLVLPHPTWTFLGQEATQGTTFFVQFFFNRKTLPAAENAVIS